GARVQLDVRKPGPLAVVEKVEVTLAKFYMPGKPIAAGPGGRPFFRGLRVDCTSLLAQQPPTPLPRIPAGVLVSEVQPHTPAGAELGYEGLEIAPFTLAPGITDVSAEQRRTLRQQAEECGLKVIGLHWLLARTEGLSLTSPDEGVRQRTADYLVELARCCRDL